MVVWHKHCQKNLFLTTWGNWGALSLQFYLLHVISNLRNFIILLVEPYSQGWETLYWCVGLTSGGISGLYTDQMFSLA